MLSSRREIQRDATLDGRASASLMFSVVVPVHNVRAYLRGCLNSILTQSWTDFEVIAVDDASPDGSGEILDEFAAVDPRVTVVHLPQNVGLGKARDEGVDRATGRYLLFVDSDDVLTPGALAAIAERITSTDDPDILIFEYARTFWTGRIVRNQTAPAFATSGPDVFRIDERPDLLELLMVVWNKAYRREWVLEHGFRFPSGYYEDLPWTYPAMLAAERIALLDRVCYHYRQRRRGNILGSPSRKHFDVFDQYARVFAYLDAHPDLENWRTLLFTRMMNHTLLILSGGRVSTAQRHEFFARIVEGYRRFRPPGYSEPIGMLGVRLRLVARNDFRAFEAVELGSLVMMRTKRGSASVVTSASRCAKAGKRVLTKGGYQAELLLPMKEDLAVYSAYWATGYCCNPAAIYEQAQRLAPHIHGVWVVKRSEVAAMPAGVDYVEQGSTAYYHLMARAKYFVSNVNFPNDIVKRSGSIYLQTNHGTPIKKMGVELRSYPVGAAGMDFTALLTRCDRWDYLLSSNRYSSEVWERAYPCAYVTLETGYPRNDRLVRATPDEIARTRRQLGIAPDATVILYAPTFRDWARQGTWSASELEGFCEQLGDGYIVLVREHYLTGGNEGLKELEEAGLLRDVSGYPVIEDLMLAADALLTDYSSVLFDYAILDRPIVIYANDWDTYVRLRGVNLDLPAAAPGVVERTLAGLVDAFTSGRFCDADAQRARHEFRNRFCGFDDGRAAERVVRRLFLGEEPPTSGDQVEGVGRTTTICAG